ncbi:MAG: hypothetical protein NPIRA06_08260 [Nitrospirales bacterium]|nr:MAG: hypothetical protein NPIRA06_08260 [Nitrospirales bacterium]
MELLDLDLLETWHSDFQDLVYQQDVWLKIEAKLDAVLPQGEEFLYQITCAFDYLRDELANLLRHRAREILLLRYSHVAGYHGCRVRDEKQYRLGGIFPSNPSALISKARSLFADIPGFEEALQDIGPCYLSHNEGKVGLLFSCIRAKDDRNTYTRGSELIRSLANRLGPEAKLRFAQTGRRSLIKCAIPTEWLENHTTFPVIGSFSKHVLEHLIRRRKWPEDDFIGVAGAYMLTRAVPPENILEFIDMTNFSDDD